MRAGRGGEGVRRAAVVALVLIVAAAAGGCKKGAEPNAGKGAGDKSGTGRGEVRSVRLAPVEKRPVDRYLELTGTLYGQEEVTVAAEVGGRIVEVAADLGDEVGPGGLLARIDPTDFRLAAEEQRASLQQSLARLGLEALPEGEIDVTTLPPVARAQAEASNAKAKLERARQLFEREPPLLSAQDFADIRTQNEVAETSVRVERLNAEAMLAEARSKASALAIAQKRLEETRIIAPMEQGLWYRVAQRRVSVGEVVGEDQAVYRLVASAELKFRGMVPERYSGQVRAGARAVVRVESRAEGFEGVVTRVSPAIDVATRAFEVELKIPNKAGLLTPGGFARASVFLRTDEGARFVPRGSVVQFAGVQRVFTVKEGKAVEVRVKAAEAADGKDGMMELVEAPGDLSEVVAEARGLAGGAGVKVEGK